MHRTIADGSMTLTTNYLKYMEVDDRLTVMLAIPGFDETEDYDHLLDEAQDTWLELSDAEILYIEYLNLCYNIHLSPEECWIGIDGWF